MKRFTKRTAMLLVAMLVLGSVLVRAEKRYVFALGDFPITDPGWGAGWVDMRLDDISRTLYIWPDGTTLAGTPAVGTGSLGQANYTAFTVGNAGWWGCGSCCNRCRTERSCSPARCCPGPGIASNGPGNRRFARSKTGRTWRTPIARPYHRRETNCDASD